MLRAVSVALALTLAAPMAASAQELPTAQKHENVTWSNAVDVAFEAGQGQEALDIVYEHFFPAAEAAGLDRPVVVEYQTGPWDVRYVFPLPEGPGSLEWEISPQDEQFWAALADQEGGAEAAQELFSRYLDMVARGQSNIVLSRARE